MSKRSRHRAALPPWVTSRPVMIDEDYQRVLDATAVKADRAHAAAQRRAENADARARRAEAQAAVARASHAEREAAKRARAEAERLWLEFQQLDRQMRERPKGAPAGPGKARVRRVGPAGSGDHDR